MYSRSSAGERTAGAADAWIDHGDVYAALRKVRITVAQIEGRLGHVVGPHAVGDVVNPRFGKHARDDPAEHAHVVILEAEIGQQSHAA